MSTTRSMTAEELVERMRAIDELIAAIRELYPEHIWSRSEILTLYTLSQQTEWPERDGPGAPGL